jgi:hypothetical protein
MDSLYERSTSFLHLLKTNPELGISLIYQNPPDERDIVEERYGPADETPKYFPDVVNVEPQIPSLSGIESEIGGDISRENQGNSIFVENGLISINSGICCSVDDTCLVNRVLIGSGKVGSTYLFPGFSVIKESKIDSINVELRNEAPTKLKEIEGKDRESEVAACLSTAKLSSLRFLGTDEFTNETLIALIVDATFREKRAPPLYLRHFDATVCKRNNNSLIGLNAIEYCDYGTLVDFSKSEATSKYRTKYTINERGEIFTLEIVSPEICYQIIVQLVASLFFLQNEINFSSGDLKAANLFVSSDPVRTRYFGFLIDSDFTIKIGDFGKSSCTVETNEPDKRPIRVYNHDPLADLYFRWLSPTLDTRLLPDGRYYYVVDDTLTFQTYARTRHLGIPFYRTFDLYTAMVSMLILPSIHYSFFISDKLKLLWSSIWTGTDDQVVLQRIRDKLWSKENISIGTAIDILRGIKLLCSATATLFHAIKKISTNPSQ